MGFLDSLRKALTGGGSAGQQSEVHWVYVQCRRCGEPLKGRIDLRNEVSLADSGEGWIVRKGLVGSGARRCFQTVEVTLTFDSQKQQVVEHEINGGTFLTEDEYEGLLKEQEDAEANLGRQLEDEQDAGGSD
jgi:hypothetical protein